VKDQFTTQEIYKIILDKIKEQFKKEMDKSFELAADDKLDKVNDNLKKKLLID
jgi:hypothetical protein